MVLALFALLGSTLFSLGSAIKLNAKIINVNLLFVYIFNLSLQRLHMFTYLLPYWNSFLLTLPACCTGLGSTSCRDCSTYLVLPTLVRWCSRTAPRHMQTTWAQAYFAVLLAQWVSGEVKVRFVGACHYRRSGRVGKWRWGSWAHATTGAVGEWGSEAEVHTRLLGWAADASQLCGADQGQTRVTINSIDY